MNGLGSVYFYIDVYKDEIKKKESLWRTLGCNGYVGGELEQMRTALLRLQQVATALQRDRAEKMTQECIEKIIGDVKGGKHGIHSNSSAGGNGKD